MEEFISKCYPTNKSKVYYVPYDVFDNNLVIMKELEQKGYSFHVSNSSLVGVDWFI